MSMHIWAGKAGIYMLAEAETAAEKHRGGHAKRFGISATNRRLHPPSGTSGVATFRSTRLVRPSNFTGDGYRWRAGPG